MVAVIVVPLALTLALVAPCSQTLPAVTPPNPVPVMVTAVPPASQAGVMPVMTAGDTKSRPILPTSASSVTVVLSVNQMLPSGPVTIPVASLFFEIPFSVVYSVRAPVVTLIEPTLSTPFSANQTIPSGPRVMPASSALLPASPTDLAVYTPSLSRTQTRFCPRAESFDSVNQTLP